MGDPRPISLTQIDEQDYTGVFAPEPLVVVGPIPGGGGGGGAVDSVNGETGIVVLTASDVGAATTAQGALADSAIQSDNLRLPILMTQAAYDAITPVNGQIYVIQG